MHRIGVLFIDEGILLGAAAGVGNVLLQRRVGLGAAGTVQGGVAAQHCQPRFQRALFTVKTARRLPDLQGDIGIALLPIPLVRQDGPQNVPDQRPVLPQKRVQRSLIAARDLLHQYALVQPYLPPLLLCLYSILHHFRPKPTENFCGDRKMP